MQRYDLMTCSGVMQEWKRRTMHSCYYRFDRGVCPKDESWQVILIVGAVAIGFMVMFVRRWLCV